MQGMCGASERSKGALCMNFVLRTAHAEEEKKGGHTNPDVRTIIIYEKSQMYHPCGARFARPIIIIIFFFRRQMQPGA